MARSRVESAVNLDRAFTLWEHIVVRLYFRSHLKKEDNIYIKRQRFVFP